MRGSGFHVPAVDELVAAAARKYAELGEEKDRDTWLLSGSAVGKGADCEPLVDQVRPMARLSAGVFVRAAQLYRERFNVGDLNAKSRASDAEAEFPPGRGCTDRQRSRCQVCRVGEVVNASLPVRVRNGSSSSR
ncbi:DUF6098 family protein [Rhodococcus qingshengii]|uniref:DUF6098 family protein n=1 Tax=Rhodococcus qingshengii TaxID=334542 RepID=UPI003557E333